MYNIYTLIKINLRITISQCDEWSFLLELLDFPNSPLFFTPPVTHEKLVYYPQGIIYSQFGNYCSRPSKKSSKIEVLLNRGKVRCDKCVRAHTPSLIYLLEQPSHAPHHPRPAPSVWAMAVLISAAPLSREHSFVNYSRRKPFDPGNGFDFTEIFLGVENYSYFFFLSLSVPEHFPLILIPISLINNIIVRKMKQFYSHRSAALCGLFCM